MTDAHRRKKNPDMVRLQLIESAIQLGMQHGLPSIGIEAVAAAAGVTKGGLFHHFPNKQALVEQVFDHMLAECAAALKTRMALDPEPHGRFTRAYVALVFDEDPADTAWNALWASTITDEQLSRQWTDWLARQLAAHGETEDKPRLQAARFAADGVWAAIICQNPPANANALRDLLLDMTRPVASR